MIHFQHSRYQAIRILLPFPTSYLSWILCGDGIQNKVEVLSHSRQRTVSWNRRRTQKRYSQYIYQNVCYFFVLSTTFLNCFYSFPHFHSPPVDLFGVCQVNASHRLRNAEILLLNGRPTSTNPPISEMYIEKHSFSPLQCNALFIASTNLCGYSGIFSSKFWNQFCEKSRYVRRVKKYWPKIPFPRLRAFIDNLNLKNVMWIFLYNDVNL